MRDLILNAPSMQSIWQRYSSFFFTFIFWGIWLVLWLPLLTLIAWYFGFTLVYLEFFQMGDYSVAIKDFSTFLIIVAQIAAVLSIWAFYNYFRFRGSDRRSVQKAITTKDTARSFEVEQSTLNEFQNEDYISVSFDETGKIIGLATLPTYSKNDLKK